MDRNQLVELISDRLHRAMGGDSSAITDLQAVVELSQLSAMIEEDDLDLFRLLGIASWIRYQALSGPEGRAALEEAISWLSHVFPHEPDDVPLALCPVLAEYAPWAGGDTEAWNSEAVRLLSSPRLTMIPEVVDRAVRLLRRAATTSLTDDPERPVILSNLGSALSIRFERLGVPTDLDEAIEVRKDAFRGLSGEDINRASILSNLGASLQLRFKSSGKDADLDEAVRVGREAVAIAPTGADRSGFLSNLGGSLRVRFERTGSLTDLDEAAEVQRDAVASVHDDHPNRASYLSGLCGVLLTRFQRTGNLPDLDEAIQRGQEAVTVVPADHPSRALYQSNLGIALQIRFKHIGEWSDLEQAIGVANQALDAIPSDHPSRLTILSNLSNALQTRFRRTGLIEDLNEAIQAGRLAANDTPADHSMKGMYLSNQSALLLSRFEWSGDLEDLDSAVCVGQDAIAATPADHPGLSMYYSNLGNALQTRFRHTGASADLDAAVQAYWEAAASIPTDHPDRPARISNLGTALLARFERLEDLADLDDAVEAMHDAVANSTNHTDRGMYLSNLSGALRARFDRTGTPTDLDDAVMAGRNAVAALPADHPDRGAHLANFGAALRVRFERDGALADLDGAVQAARDAVIAAPAEHPDRSKYAFNLGNVLWLRFEISGDEHARQEALAAYREAAELPTAAPLVRATSAKWWARLAADTNDWAEANTAWNTLFEVLPLVVDAGLDRADRQHHLSLLTDIGTDAAATALQRNDVQKAWALLESGRGVLLSQAFQARTDVTDLAVSLPDLAAEVVHHRRLLHIDSRSDSHSFADVTSAKVIGISNVVTQRRRLASDWQRLLANIRDHDGFRRFGLPPTIDAVRQDTIGGVAVALNVSSSRCDALILSSENESYLNLPGLTRLDAIDQANAFLSATSYAGSRGSTTVDAVLTWLWERIVSPVLDHLGFTAPSSSEGAWPRVWWIPTGPLSVLPIHAAGRHNRLSRDGALDRVISSYTPTLRALRYARNQRLRGGSKALVVGIDKASGQAPLRFARAEAVAVGDMLDDSGSLLLDDAATYDAVMERLPSATWAHFACHGTPADDPADSALMLADRPLHAREIVGLEVTGAYLAYLSACTTAFGGTSLLDESIHTASAFAVSGFQHVIATLWPINDAVAPTLTRRIYGQLTAGVPPSLALHHTVRAIRDQYPDRPRVWAAHIHIGP